MLFLWYQPVTIATPAPVYSYQTFGGVREFDEEAIIFAWYMENYG